MTTDQSCANCYYFYKTSSKDYRVIGFCRANPPAAFYEKDPETGDLKPKVARFPILLGSMWCGLWEQERPDEQIKLGDEEYGL